MTYPPRPPYEPGSGSPGGSWPPPAPPTTPSRYLPPGQAPRPDAGSPQPQAPGQSASGPGPAGPGGGGPGGSGPGDPMFPPRPPRRPRSRVLPIILGILIMCGMGVFSLLMFGSMFIGANPFSNIHLKSGNIGVIRIEGPIQPGPYFDFWMKTLRSFDENDAIKGVIVRVNSPGGTVGSSQELYDAIIRLRTPRTDGTGARKVYISMGDVAASGAYYLAAAGDRIYANRGTLTGSIGVITQLMRYEELAEKVGIDIEVIKTGRFKDSGSGFREMTDEERKLFDQLLGNTYDQFIDDIYVRRAEVIEDAWGAFEDYEWSDYQFDPEAVQDSKDFLRQTADGRVYTGEQAYNLGLVDKLGGLDLAVAELARDLGIQGKPTLNEPQLRVTFADLLSMKVGDLVPDVGASYPLLHYRMTDLVP